MIGEFALGGGSATELIEGNILITFDETGEVSRRQLSESETKDYLNGTSSGAVDTDTD